MKYTSSKLCAMEKEITVVITKQLVAVAARSKA